MVFAPTITYCCALSVHSTRNRYFGVGDNLTAIHCGFYTIHARPFSWGQGALDFWVWGMGLRVPELAFL